MELQPVRVAVERGPAAASGDGGHLSLAVEDGASYRRRADPRRLPRAVAGSARVEVLLSTWNGERYLCEQLDSLFAQDHAPLALTIRDDGSTDGTPDLLARFAGRPGVSLVAGRRVGAAASYFALIEAASPESDYLALCDQDDVWRPDKISRAVARLSAAVPPAVPGLYCARALIVDAALRERGVTPLLRRGPGFANALVENAAMGSTILLNRAARERLLRGWPRHVVMHDWWCYLVVSAFGRVVFDPEPVIRYRQHGGNHFGAGSTAARRLARKVVRQLRGGHGGILRRQAAEFRRIHGDDLPAGERAVLDAFLDGTRSLPGRVRYALGGAAFRQSPVDNLVLRLLYLLGRV